jgi:DNA-binding MarR family transcriptional regulator
MPLSLNAELRQDRPFHSAAEEAYLSVQRAADGLRREIAALLKSYELTPTQYNVLRILRGAGKDGHLTGEIAERLVVRDPDAPRLLDRMEKRGLVHRRRQTDDRRCVRVTITPAGRALVDRLDEPVQGLHLQQFKALNRTSLRALIETLAAVREHAHQRSTAG